MKMLNKHIINIRESMHLDRSKFTSLLLDSIYSLEEEKRREEKRRITHSQNFQPVVGAI